MEQQKIYGIIYKATNKVNGKIYIGQTTYSLGKRIFCHISHALNNRDNMYFHKAIRKYGVDNFVWEIIAKCNSLEELNKTEIKMIEKHNTFEKGYNLTKGGEGQSGFKHSEETRKKISNNNKGKKHSKETREKMAESQKGEKSHNYGKHPAKETIRKMSESRMSEKNHMYGRRGSKSPRAKKYIVITPRGKEIFVHGIVEFCKNYKEEKLDYNCLVQTALGRQKQHKGYKCRYFIE